MTDMAEIDTKEWRILNLESKSATKFEVPRIQRTYTWKMPQLRDFINDLIQVSQDSNREHYFGAFCTMKKSNDDDTELIIDGQQRIATSHLFLKYAQEKVIDPTLTDKISNIIATDNPKVTLGKKDQEIFMKIMKGDDVSDQQSLLRDAYKGFDTLLGRHEQKKIMIEDLVYTLLERFRMVKIRLPYKNFGPTFHLVNNRGRDLTESELIKSHIFMELETELGKSATADLDKLDEQWTEMYSAILSSGGNATTPVDRFILHVLSIKYGQTKLDAIYNRYICDLESINSSESQLRGKIWLEDLFEWAKRYVLLLGPPEEFSKPWKAGRLDARNWLQRIRNLKAVNVYPVLLASYEKYYNTDPHSFYKLIDSCYRFHIRMITLGCLDVVTYTNFMQDTAHEIWTNKLETLDDVIKKLKNYISDCEKNTSIKSIYAALSNIKTTQAKHCLLLIEEYKYGIEKIANIPTVEHILPRKYEGSKWDTYIKNYYTEDPKYWIHNLGNMTLLSHKINAKVKRKLFSEKFEEYNSSYGITQELKEQNSWTIGDIENRCKEYARVLNDALNITKHPIKR